MSAYEVGFARMLIGDLEKLIFTRFGIEIRLTGKRR